MVSVVTGFTGDRQAGLRFEEFPDELYEGLRLEIEALSLELFGRVEALTPSKTGQLRSQERVRQFADEKRIAGYIDIGDGTINDLKKAGALEYGAHKTGQVESHSRKLDHVFDRALSAPMNVIVKAYPRTPNIATHAFERGPLAMMRGEIVERLNAVVEKSVAGANK
jgi:hypothetical protein